MSIYLFNLVNSRFVQILSKSKICPTFVQLAMNSHCWKNIFKKTHIVIEHLAVDKRNRILAKTPKLKQSPLIRPKFLANQNFGQNTFFGRTQLFRPNFPEYFSSNWQQKHWFLAKMVYFGWKSILAELPKMDIAKTPKPKHNFGQNFGQNWTETVSVCPLHLGKSIWTWTTAKDLKVTSNDSMLCFIRITRMDFNCMINLN